MGRKFVTGLKFEHRFLLFLFRADLLEGLGIHPEPAAGGALLNRPGGYRYAREAPHDKLDGARR
jgi:hypothetical protein